MNILLKFFSSFLFFNKSWVGFENVLVFMAKSFVNVFKAVTEFVHCLYDLFIPNCFAQFDLLLFDQFLMNHFSHFPFLFSSYHVLCLDSYSFFWRLSGFSHIINSQWSSLYQISWCLFFILSKVGSNAICGIFIEINESLIFVKARSNRLSG